MIYRFIYYGENIKNALAIYIHDSHEEKDVCTV